MEFKTIVTRIGLAKIAEASVTNQKLELKTMAFGDGGGEYPEIDENMSALVNEVYRGDIENIEVITENKIKLSRIIPADVGGFYIREIGIFDPEDNLIAVGMFPQTYKPTIEEGSVKDIVANMIVNVENSNVIEVVIDPNVVTATKGDLAELKDEIGDINYIDEITRNEFSLVFRNNIPYFRVEKGDE